MKIGLVIILFLTLSLTGFAQQNVIVNINSELVVTLTSEMPEAKKSNISAKFKAKVLKLNHKKSNEIISIRAYRKSLQIRMKTKKLC